MITCCDCRDKCADKMIICLKARQRGCCSIKLNMAADNMLLLADNASHPRQGNMSTFYITTYTSWIPPTISNKDPTKCQKYYFWQTMSWETVGQIFLRLYLDFIFWQKIKSSTHSWKTFHLLFWMDSDFNLLCQLFNVKSAWWHHASVIKSVAEEDKEYFLKWWLLVVIAEISVQIKW